MPVETRPLLEPLLEPVVDLLIGVHEARRQKVWDVHGKFVPRIRVKALVDTGSWNTFVDETVFSQLEISEVDTQLVQPVSMNESPQEFRVFAVSLSFPESNGGSEKTFLNQLVLGYYTRPDDEIKAILGRDVLQHCRFQYDGVARAFTLSYD